MLTGFAGYEDVDLVETMEEYGSKCYLKTKNEHYRKHWMTLSGNELRFYEKKNAE